MLPHYVQEVEGMAEGAGLPFKTVMMLNISCPPGMGGKEHKGESLIHVLDINEIIL